MKLGEFIEVASEVSKQLGAPRSGLYAGWLQETVGKLTASEPRLIRAISTWGSPIATTNYDTLLSQQTGLEPITWKDHSWLAQFFDGDVKRVLHLHGVYTRPETVVLGARSYEDVIRDREIQDAMKALVFGKTLVFVGCGVAGLGDPNIGGLISWYKDVLGEMVRPSYLLVSEPEREGWRPVIEGSQIRVISYGASHAALPGFLEQVTGQVSQRRLPDRPLDILVRAQPTFDQRLHEILARKEELGTSEMMRQLMELVRSHWQSGGRRSAWMAVAGRLQNEGKALQAEERLRFGLELANMMFADGMPDDAFGTLRELLADVESGDVRPDQRHQYWETQSRCLQAMGPYVDTKHALERAITTAPDEATRLTLEAELAEFRFLQGEDDTTPDQPERASAE
ncbi:MAG: SIR2 family protein [Isosphaeraceae bacterium]|nr:SIR2 family protein [Isosphaeraceae bacterium]